MEGEAIVGDFGVASVASRLRSRTVRDRRLRRMYQNWRDSTRRTNTRGPVKAWDGEELAACEGREKRERERGREGGAEKGSEPYRLLCGLCFSRVCEGSALRMYVCGPLLFFRPVETVTSLNPKRGRGWNRNNQQPHSINQAINQSTKRVL